MNSSGFFQKLTAPKDILYEIPITKTLISQIFRDAVLRHTDDVNDILNWEDFGEGATFAGTILFNIDEYMKQLEDELGSYEIGQIAKFAQGLINKYFVTQREYNDEKLQEAEQTLRDAVKLLITISNT